VDGELFCIVPEETVSDFQLRVGQTVTPRLLEQLQSGSARSEALEAALRLLGHRARSRVELVRQLRRSGHAPGAVEAAMIRCDELGYLDDAAFAQAHVRDRLKFRPRGRRVLLAELRTKGVGEEVARGAIEEVFSDAGVDEAGLADAIALKRLRSLEGLPASVARRRLTAYLARRGFPSATIRQTVMRTVIDQPAD
jgi:regulatory protein